MKKPFSRPNLPFTVSNNPFFSQKQLKQLGKDA